MSTNALSDDQVLDMVAEELVKRVRMGEKPDLATYIERCPHLADRLRQLVPVLVAMEKVATIETTKIPSKLADYRLVRQLGGGGMGVVYEAVQESLNRTVAVKVLLPNRATDLARFQFEARAAGRLRHTNVVPIFGVGQADGLHYLVMQYVPGCGLNTVLHAVRRQQNSVAMMTTPKPFVLQSSQLVDPDRRVEADELASGLLKDGPAVYYTQVARIIAEAADGLAHAHAHGVVHRDMKPGNILIDGSLTAWVTDFGLAKASRVDEADNLTDPGELVGTLRYMPPERFRGQSDTRGDVYGLGVTLYELLTLRPAFPQTDKVELQYAIAFTTPPRPRELVPEVPICLERVVRKAMAVDPNDRYASAAALAEDLRRFLNGRTVRECWRFPRLSEVVRQYSLTAALVLIAFLFGVLAHWLMAG